MGTSAFFIHAFSYSTGDDQNCVSPEETTLMTEKLYHAKTKLITKIKEFVKNHLISPVGWVER